MKKLRILASALALALPFAASAQIQQFAIGSLGGEITASNGVSFTHSIGDVGGGFTGGSTPKFTAGFPQCFACDGCSIVNVIELAPDLDLTIFPNPSTGWLDVKGDAQRLSGFQVFNMQGVMQMQGKYAGGPVDIRSLSGGVYLICFVDEQGRRLAVAKLIKQ